MYTRIAHIGDVHAAPGPRNEDRWRVLDQIRDELVRTERLGAVLIPGDLNDGRMAIDDRNRLAEWIGALAYVAPVVIVPGNHDLPGDLSIFGRLRTRHPVFVVDRPQIIGIALATGQQANIFCLPWPTEAGLLAAGVAQVNVPDAARAALDAIFMEHGAMLADDQARGILMAACGHVTVTGAVASNGQPSCGKHIELDAALIARLGGCYFGLNHIHAAQHIAGAWYAGSTYRQDFGELEPKGWLLVEYADAATFTVRTMPIDVPAMWHVEATFKDGAFTWTPTKGPDGPTLEPPASWKGCEVRVRAHYRKSDRAFFEMGKAQLMADFAEAKLTIDPAVIPDRELRAPEVAAARTLPEKVLAWARLAGVELPDGTFDLLTVLEGARDEVALIAEAERQVAASWRLTQPEQKEAMVA